MPLCYKCSAPLARGKCPEGHSQDPDPGELQRMRDHFRDEAAHGSRKPGDKQKELVGNEPTLKDAAEQVQDPELREIAERMLHRHGEPSPK